MNHVMKAFIGNGYTCSFTKPLRKHDGEGEEDRPPTFHLPYVASMNERIRRVCKDSNIRMVFRPPFSPSSKQMLSTRYRAPAERCTMTRLHVDLKHVWRMLVWKASQIILDGGPSMNSMLEFVIKEAICIRTTLESLHFNRDSGYNISDCTYRKLRAGTPAGHTHPTTLYR